jgi:hypothetical protein
LPSADEPEADASVPDAAASVPALAAESSELSELEPHPAKRVVVIATQSNALNNFFFILFSS